MKSKVLRTMLISGVIAAMSTMPAFASDYATYGEGTVDEATGVVTLGDSSAMESSTESTTDAMSEFYADETETETSTLDEFYYDETETGSTEQTLGTEVISTEQTAETEPVDGAASTLYGTITSTELEDATSQIGDTNAAAGIQKLDIQVVKKSAETEVSEETAATDGETTLTKTGDFNLFESAINGLQDLIYNLIG